MSIVIDSKLWESNTPKLSDKVISLLLKYKYFNILKNTNCTFPVNVYLSCIHY